MSVFISQYSNTGKLYKETSEVTATLCTMKGKISSVIIYHIKRDFCGTQDTM